MRDKRKVARSFSRAAETYDTASALQERVRGHTCSLFEKHIVPALPESELRMLDLGCGTGGVIEKVFCEGMSWLGLDLAEGMLRVARKKHGSQIAWLCGDADALPLRDASVDGVLSSLALQWSERMDVTTRELFRVLKPGGFCLISTLAPRTLFELKSAWAEVDDYTHVNEFSSEKACVEAFSEAGFKVCLTEQSLEKTYYTALVPLMRDLKLIGAHNVNTGQRQGLMGIRQLRRLEEAYEKFRAPNGQLPASYDVLYLLVKRPEE